MGRASFRFFDHTGDFGAEVTGPDLAAVAEGVAAAFLALLTDAADVVDQRDDRELEVSGVDAAATLVALGNELVFLFEAEGFLCARFEAQEADETVIRGVAWGEPYDPARHPIARPVKAVTHHGAELTETEDGGLRARLIFDL